MNPSHNHGRALRQTLQVAIIAAAALPALAHAADSESERRQREFEELRLERDQAIAQREMQQRERIQQDALRSQQQILQRQEQRMEEMRSRLDEASRQYAEAASNFGRSFNYGIGSTLVSAPPPPRALIGVAIDTAERRDGALVQTVSPGGAAEEAGIRSGDLITAIDGKDLTKEQNPGRALVEALQNVKPDTTVKLAVLRDGRRMNFDVMTRAAPAVALRSLPDLRELESRLGIQGRSNVPGIIVAQGDGGMRFGGMEFATLSERLGNYFGVKSGVLVVRAGANAPFSLQDGDVILSIDGRVPTTAQHAGRILRSYQPGEKVKLRVQRDRKAIDIDATAPNSSD